MVPRPISVVDELRSMARVLQQSEHCLCGLASLSEPGNQEICVETSGSARWRCRPFQLEEDGVHWENDTRSVGRLSGEAGDTFSTRPVRERFRVS